MTKDEVKVEQEQQRTERLRERRQAQEALRAYEKLQESPEWNTLCALLKEQAEQRERMVLLTPLASADAAFGQEFMKGEAAALRLVVRLPEVTREGLRDQVSRLTEMIGDGDE